MARFKRGKRKWGGLKRRRSFKRGGRKFNKRVKRAINKFAEKKYIDANPLFNAGVGTVPTLIPMGFNPSQGTTQATRIGNAIYRRSLTIRGTLSGDNNYTQWRIIVFCWNNQVLGTPLPGDILESTALPLLSFWNRSNLQMKRFTPMYDRLITMNGGGAAQFVKQVRLRFSGKRLPWKKTTYNVGTTTTDHAYYMMVMSDHLITSPVVFTCIGRMTYTDV